MGFYRRESTSTLEIKRGLVMALRSKQLENNKTINQLHETEYRWFAVYTKYKAEKYVLDHLTRKGIQAYVPLLNSTKRYASKIKTYRKPLINCYVFVCITKSEYIQVLETEYVIKFLKQRRDLIAIPEEEIDTLRKIVGEFEGVTVVEDPVVGQPVELIHGNLTGLKGIVTERKGKKEFVVTLDNIGFQMALEVSIDHLRSLQ